MTKTSRWYHCATLSNFFFISRMYHQYLTMKQRNLLLHRLHINTVNTTSGLNSNFKHTQSRDMVIIYLLIRGIIILTVTQKMIFLRITHIRSRPIPNSKYQRRGPVRGRDTLAAGAWPSCCYIHYGMTLSRHHSGNAGHILPAIPFRSGRSCCYGYSHHLQNGKGM